MFPPKEVLFKIFKYSLHSADISKLKLKENKPDLFGANYVKYKIISGNGVICRNCNLA